MDEKKKTTERVTLRKVLGYRVVRSLPFGHLLSNALNACHACSLAFLADALVVYS